MIQRQITRKVLRRIARKYFYQLRIIINHKLISEINNQKCFLPGLAIAYRSVSKRHTLGGLRGYSINGLGRINPVFSIKVLLKLRTSKFNFRNFNIVKSADYPRYLDEHKFNSKVLNEKLKEMKILAIVPKNWSNTLGDYGFPHLLHLSRSAEIHGIKFWSLNVEEIISFISENRFLEVKKKFASFSPNVIMLSGHKNSYHEEFSHFLASLKSQEKYLITMIFLDDWSSDYGRVANSWRDSVDLFLTYEYNSFVERKLNELGLRDRCAVEPFPRFSFDFIPNSDESSVNNILRFAFNGSLYLSRLPWLFIISQYLKQNWPGVSIDIYGNSGPGAHHKTIEEYFRMYSTKQTIFFHFLERTPNNFSFTSSVWDAFSCGALVLVQVGKESDPLADFFVPNVHYLRFSSLDELCLIIDSLCRSPNLAVKIAREGFHFWQQNYNGTTFYSTISTYARK